MNKKENNEKEGYLYIIHLREFINTKENIYKIGCTYNLERRVKQYPKNSKLIFNVKIDNFRTIERIWINSLIKTAYVNHRKDIGKEYFECNPELILNELLKLI